MGDWETSWNRDVLERIVALLFSLACLAEFAADAPFLCRRRVVKILDCAEFEARAFVIGMVSDAPVPMEAMEPAGDAARLAVRLRALALILCLVLAQGVRCTLPHMAGPRIGRRPAAPAGRRALAPAPDTS